MRSRFVNTVILSATLLFATSALVFSLSSGCSTSQQRIAVNSLKSTGEATDAAFRTFLDGVVAGRIKTNSVPQVAAAYNTFQIAWNAAVVAATMNSNAPPDVATANAASQVDLAIKAAKQR